AGWPTGEPFALWPRMQAISLDVVMSAVFDDLDGARRELLRERLVALTDWINRPRRLALLAAVGKRSIAASAGFRRVMGDVEAAVLEEVRRRRAAGVGHEREDIHSMLEREYGGEESRQSERKLRDELVTMLCDDGDEYLDAVVKETLRLCPAVPLVMRRLAEPMQLGAYRVPRDAIVAPSVYLMHRRADLYEDPLR